MSQIKNIVEALLLSSGEPLSADKIHKIGLLIIPIINLVIYSCVMGYQLPFHLFLVLHL